MPQTIAFPTRDAGEVTFPRGSSLGTLGLGAIAEVKKEENPKERKRKVYHLVANQSRKRYKRCGGKENLPHYSSSAYVPGGVDYAIATVNREYLFRGFC